MGRTARTANPLQTIGFSGVQEISGGQVEVTAIDPLASMQAVENPALKDITSEISNKPGKVTERV